MKEIHALFAGTGSAEAVLKAADAKEGKPDAAVKMQQMYAQQIMQHYMQQL